MARKKRGLGRGLDALLGSAGVDAVATAKAAGVLRMVPVEHIRPNPQQPRQDFSEEALQQLGESIRTRGMLQPVLLRPVGEGRYELIAGERRWRAAQRAQLQEVPAVLREVDEDESAVLALVENLQREDLNAVEQARGLHKLVQEQGLSHEQAGHLVGASRSAVSNLLRLLELPAAVQQMLIRGELEMAHGRALLGLPRTQQTAVARRVAAQQLSVRQTESLVRRSTAGKGRKRRGAPDPDVARLERELGDALGARVAVRHEAGGRGRLVIAYRGLAELQGILEKIVGKKRR